MPRKKNEKQKESAEDFKQKEQNELKNEVMDELFTDDTLTSKEQNFILNYLSTYNAGISYMRAYNTKKKEVARTKGYLLLKNKRIRAALLRLRKLIANNLEIDPLEYVDYNIRVAKSDIGDYMQFYTEEVPETDVDGSPVLDENGNQKMKKISRLKFKDSDECDTSILSAVSQGRDGIKLDLPNKYKAWENLRTFFDWGNKKENNTQTNSLIEAINTSTKKLYSEEENKEISDADWKNATKDY